MVEGTPTQSPDIQLFRDAFDASPIGIAIENLEGQPLFVNPAFCSLLGFSEEELRRKHCVDFSPKEDAEKDWALFQQLRAGAIERYQMEKRYFHRDGSLIWGRLSLSLLNSHQSPLVIAIVEDITEKKKLEEAWFSQVAILDSSEDAIICKNLDGTITSWNPAAQQLFGYTESEAVGQPITILIPPELQHEESNILKRIGAGQRIEHYETIRITKAGKRIDVSLSISPIKDSSGRVVGASKIARDITERKRAEQALQESEERLRLAVQAGRMFAYSWDTTTDVIEHSGDSAQILGVDPKEVATGAAVLAMVHSDDKERFEAAMAKLTVENPTDQVACRMIRRDGSVVWLEWNSRAHFDGNGKLERTVGTVADVTERKQSEEKWREYERVVEGSQDMVAVVDRDYRYIIVNRQFLKMKQMAREQMVGSRVYELMDRTAFEQVVKPKLEECFRGKSVKYEMKLTYPRVGERDLSISYFPIQGFHHVEQAACILQDITERKRTEQVLASMSRKLVEAQEQERARIGRELHDDITQRLALLTVELEQLRGNPSDVGIRVQELRKQVIDLAKDVQALSHDLHSSKLEYLGVIAGIKSWCREFAERQKIEINCTTDVSSAPSRDIGLTLFRILQEALHNAIKHSGVKRVEVQLREEGGEIHLIVSDTGRGFDVKAALEGNGLGLTSMGERVRLVNGKITIDSKPMGGTTIHVRIPSSSTCPQWAAG